MKMSRKTVGTVVTVSSTVGAGTVVANDLTLVNGLPNSGGGEPFTMVQSGGKTYLIRSAELL